MNANELAKSLPREVANDVSKICRDNCLKDIKTATSFVRRAMSSVSKDEKPFFEELLDIIADAYDRGWDAREKCLLLAEQACGQ